MSLLNLQEKQMMEKNISQTSVTDIGNTDLTMERDCDTFQLSSQILQKSLTSAIAKLEKEIQEKLRQLLSNQKQQLSEVGEKINALTQELEQAILDFHKIARVANHTNCSLQSFVKKIHNTTEGNHQSVIPDELNIVAIHHSKLPVVKQHGSGYILKDKTVDLSKLV